MGLTNRTRSVLVACGGISLLAMVAAISYSGRLLSVSMERIDELMLVQEATDKVEIGRALEAIKEQRNFIVSLSRSGRRTADSVSFIATCSESLRAVATNERYAEEFPELVAESLFGLGQLSSLTGEKLKAIECLQRAIVLGESSGNIRIIGFAKNTLACVQVDLRLLEEAQVSFLDSVQALQKIPNETVELTLAARNLLCLRLSRGTADAAVLEQAVMKLRSEVALDKLSPPAEVLIDSLVVLAEVYLQQGQIESALEASQEALERLKLAERQAESTLLESSVVNVRSYRRARKAMEQNLGLVRELGKRVAAPKTIGPDQWKSSPAAADMQSALLRWQWQWLFNIRPDVIDKNPMQTAQMCAEFEPQAGLTVFWGEYPWVNQATREVVRNAWNRLRVVVLVQDETSYYDALDAFESIGVPTDELRFTFQQVDSPWLRDLGPIACRQVDGQSLWFDSLVIRSDMKQRVECDALPSILAKNWRTQLANTALFAEGGALLSNGDGLTVCSSVVRRVNSLYGFDNQRTDEELRRITGATQVLHLDPMIGEPTEHIDMFMNFISSNTVVVGEFGTDDANARLLDDHAAKLAACRVDGKPLNVIRIPMPAVENGIFRTYTNVIFANGVLLVPSWTSQPAAVEENVRAIYQRLLPDWQIVMIDCSDLIERQGALHCLVSNLGVAQLQEMDATK